MKKIAILTINDNNNYGNRLQNYAIQRVLLSRGDCVETIWNNADRTLKDISIIKLKTLFKKFKNDSDYSRYKNFSKFSKLIKHSRYKINNRKNPKYLNKKYDYFITGSDQVWNTNYKRFSFNDFLSFAEMGKRISFAASFGTSNIETKYGDRIKQEISSFRAISVREDAGKKIIENMGINKEIIVLVDPTMLLSAEEWDTVSNKPQKEIEKKYILNYFLGTIPDNWKSEITKIADRYDCEVINILDKNDPYYTSGPSEFLYLIKNAFLVCTDSFHSSIFSIIYETPFIVFERQGSEFCMNSRLDTLLSKFRLKDRKFNEKIPDTLLECDYTETKHILEQERKKSYNFLSNALNEK